MAWGIDRITDLDHHRQLVRQRPYGRITIRDGQFEELQLRPWPTQVFWWQAWCDQRWFHRRRSGNCCQVYYNQPRSFPQFLAASYVVSTRQTTWASAWRGLCVLEKVARLKGCCSLLCDVSNARISDRLMARLGFVPHAPMRWHRNFIKRLDQADARKPGETLRAVAPANLPSPLQIAARAGLELQEQPLFTVPPE